MSGIIGNNIVRNGLVLCLDAGSSKSCSGQPVTNLLTYSDTINSVWYGYCGPTSNITYNTTDVTDPSGTNTAVKIARNNSNGCFGVGDVAMGLLYSISPGVILSSGKTYTASIYARGASGGETFVYGLNDTHGVGTTLTSGWVRYTTTFSNITNTDRGFQFYNSTATSQVYYVWGPQVTLGTVAGDYVASVGAANGTKNLTFRDLSGNNNNSLFVNNPIYSTANIGNISFDGSAQYVSIDNSSSLQVADTFTVCAWIKANNLSARYGIFSTRLTNPSGAWQFEVGTGSSGTNRILITGLGTWIAESVDNVISSGQWCYISVVKVNNATQGASLYVNGYLVSNSTTSAYTISNNSDAKRIAQGTGSGQHFPGSMGQVYLYNRALSASEILQNFNATRKRFNI
jgi:hypothetical protein